MSTGQKLTYFLGFAAVAVIVGYWQAGAGILKVVSETSQQNEKPLISPYEPVDLVLAQDTLSLKDSRTHRTFAVYTKSNLPTIINCVGKDAQLGYTESLLFLEKYGNMNRWSSWLRTLSTGDVEQLLVYQATECE